MIRLFVETSLQHSLTLRLGQYIGQSTILVTLVSLLTVTATPSLDGTTITCRDGVNDIENVPLTVPGI